ncbi:hypothetical protein MHLP_01900 [Candidatus Mycoplasma haematolamae str. Purdue]|uniref:DUF2779 domain-containing protein n=1 Tax=Mycoplasma haematolamae (strain Purdue) TaxID=1212765 RepID=I7B9N4_MYCHA|nr:hypothetical protein [Candidatus Mycoplasma haematolamae]AFO51960.1 hypothetical protein MHLP_01900 [Candidatus Mycoplasma haematolamae str. Purdue]
MKAIREKLFPLNYKVFKRSFEWPFEFSFLSEESIRQIVKPKSFNDGEGAFSNFFGLPLSKAEQDAYIIQKINKKAEAALYRSNLEEIIKKLHLSSQEVYTFRGSESDFADLLKRLEGKEVVLIFAPELQLAIENLSITLKPLGLLKYKEKFSLLIQSTSGRPGAKYLPELLFNYLFLKDHLNLEVQEAVVLLPSSRDKPSEFVFSLPMVKSPTKDSKPRLLPLYLALGFPKPTYEESWFSKVFSREDYDSFNSYDSLGAGRSLETLLSELSLLKKSILQRLRDLNQLSLCYIETKDFYSRVKETGLVNWYQLIDWKAQLSVRRLEANYLHSKSFGRLFDTDSALYKLTISYLLPALNILSSSLVDIKKAFPLIERLNRLTKTDEVNYSFESFLGELFRRQNNKLDFSNQKDLNSVFSKEGKELLDQDLLSVGWKVYYDFESHKEMLTQMSLQIYCKEELILSEDLIFDPREVEDPEVFNVFSAPKKEGTKDTFDEQCIYKLATPFFKLLKSEDWRAEEKAIYKKLQGKVVFVSFNKTFECEWLKRLAARYEKYNPEASLLALLVKNLTIDLSDWFKFSRNLSLNLIGEMMGAHNLKKLSQLVAGNIKQYSELDWARDGRTAQQLYYYYFSEIFNFGNIQELPNEDLAPSEWRRDYLTNLDESWRKISSYLTEYCALDVQNMIEGVNWLIEKYEENKEFLLPKDEILEFISWFKTRNAEQLGDLILDYVSTDKS